MSSDRHLGNAVPAFGKSVWMLCIALFFVAYAAQTVSPVMLFYTVDLRLSTTDLTLFFTVYAIGLMIGADEHVDGGHQVGVQFVRPDLTHLGVDRAVRHGVQRHQWLALPHVTCRAPGVAQPLPHRQHQFR